MHWLVLNPDIQFVHARPKNALRAPIVVNHVLNVHILRYLDNNYFESPWRGEVHKDTMQQQVIQEEGGMRTRGHSLSRGYWFPTATAAT